MTASSEQADEFATAFRAFLEWIHQPVTSPRNEVVDLVRGHLGRERSTTSVVTRAVPVFDHVNLQVALDAWTAQPGRQVRIEGLVVPQHHDTPELQQLLRGIEQLIVRPGPPALIDLANGPASTLACLQTALLLVTDARGRYVLLVRGPERHRQPSLTVDIAGLPVEQAQQVHNELASLRSQLNVYRGRVLELEPSDMGGVRLSFVTLPPTARADVVLPEAVLRRIERHTVDIAGHREQLRSAGQHLKRGLLLFGPPGTGKTHTTRYVVGQMAGSTVLMLSGRSLGAIGAIAGLARELAPAVIVLEDVDLVAEDRGYGPGSNPVLFELLDAMDGAAADADLLFLLTTNRADLLEPALAARPGRVDVAVQIGLPDGAARARLFQLYSRGVPLDLADSDVAEVVQPDGRDHRVADQGDDPAIGAGSPDALPGTDRRHRHRRASGPGRPARQQRHDHPGATRGR